MVQSFGISYGKNELQQKQVLKCQWATEQDIRNYKVLAVQGIARAENRLAWLYLLGCGLEKDSVLAKRLFVRASLRGYRPAILAFNALF